MFVLFFINFIGAAFFIIYGDKQRNFITESLDLFNQSQPSFFANSASVFTKFINPSWERNQISRALRSGIQDIDEFNMTYTEVS